MIHRVSFVDHWRKWRSGEDKTLEDLFSNVESEAMRVGTAFHKARELAQPGVYQTLEANGYTFEIPDDFTVESAPFKELRFFKRYMVDGEPITITGQVDQVSGRRVDDDKTTARFDPDRYLMGAQWKLYLDITELDHFRWNVFVIEEVDDMRYRVKETHRLEQHRYPGLEKDCQRLIEDFARFMRQVETEKA